MHVFKYSPRKGTKAAVMPNQIDGNIKEARSKRLIELSQNNELEYNKSHISDEVEVLFEERDGDYYKGHTKNYIVVKYKTQDELENCILKLKVVYANKDYLIAE